MGPPRPLGGSKKRDPLYRPIHDPYIMNRISHMLLGDLIFRSLWEWGPWAKVLGRLGLSGPFPEPMQAPTYIELGLECICEREL